MFWVWEIKAIMPLIPEEIIAQVIDRCDIVEVVSSYIPLKQAGRNFKANCPFHNEKTPSFVVNPDKQIFHCFGCGTGGNVISFVMKQERMEFPEAVRVLAQKANVMIPDEDRAHVQAANVRQEILKVNTLAVNYFQKVLLSDRTPAGQKAREYLKDRGVALDTAHKFQLGFAPDSWDGLQTYLKGWGVSLSLMEKAGLIIPRENGQGFYDRFRNRIIFPIFDTRAHCRAFGARSFGEEKGAKYINSPETIIYTKGHHLYGFHLAKQAVGEQDCVIIVEGYMDFLMPYQAGVTNIVASLGTALTVDQIRLLRRYTHHVVMLFDTDPAGESAILRSLDTLIEEGMEVTVATLASGQDPDSYIRQCGAQAFRDRISKRKGLFDYKLEILAGRFDKNAADGKGKIAAEMLPTVYRFKNMTVKAEYLKRLSGAIGISEEVLIQEYGKVSNALSQRISERLQEHTAVNQARVRAVERNILKLMIEKEGLISKARAEVSPSDFQDGKIRTAVSKIFELFEQGKKITTSSLINSFEDVGIQQMLTGIVAEEEILGDREKVYSDCINRIKHDKLKLQRQRLLREIQEAESSGDGKRVGELTKQFNQSIKK
jgi:DNA primase